MTTARPLSAAHRLRAGLLGLVLAVVMLAAAVLIARVLLRDVRRAGAAPVVSVDDAVPLIALAVLAAGVGWLAVVLAAVSVQLLPVRRGALGLSRPGRAALAPATGSLAMRACGLLLAVTAIGSGSALESAAANATSIVAAVDAPARDAGQRDPRAAAAQVPVPDLDPTTTAPPIRSSEQRCPAPVPGWSTRGPGLQRSASTDQAGLLGRCGAAAGEEVVVHRGDTLWSIVAHQLGPGSTAREVAAQWPAWYAANRAVIGPDPDLLLPGTTLHRPTQEVPR